MIKVSASFVFILFSCLCFGQSFHGIVRDKNNQEPIADVHIALRNSANGTITDKGGNFSLGKLQNDSVEVQISAIGYTSIVKKLSVNGSEQVIELTPSVIQLNNAVTVTALRSERLAFDVSQSVTSLSYNQVKQLAPRSTPEALMSETGIWVQKTNHGGGSPIIRGLVGNQVLMMVDGIRLNNATYRYGPNQYLSTVDPGMVERIEVTRGAGSVLYGSDALGGVIQVISRAPSFRWDGLHIGGSATGKWMSGGMEQSARGEVEVSDKRVAFLGGFSARIFGDIVAGGTLGTLTPTGYTERSGDAKLLFRTGANGILTAAFQQLTQADVPRYDQVVQGGFSVYNFEPQTRQLSYLKFETATKSKWVQSIRLTASLNRSIEGLTSQKTNATDSKKQSDEVTTMGWMAELTSNPKTNWHAQSGIDYYADNVSSNAKLTNAITQSETSQRGSYADGATVSNLAIYTNHQIDFNKFQLSAGGRFNSVKVSVSDDVFGNQSINPFALVGNAGVLYKLHPHLRTTVGINTGFRAPNVDDMSKFGTVEANVFEIPSAGLSPERSLNIEGGFKYSSPRLSWTVTAYQTKLSQLIDRVPATYNDLPTFDNRTVYQKQNVGEAMIQGLEADAEFSVSSLKIFSNITYTYGENETKKEPMRRIPPLFGKVGTHYVHPSGVWVRAEWVMAGKQDRLAAGDKSDARIKIRLIDDTMPGWDIVNLYAGYSYRLMSVQLSVQNIFDKAYRVYASGVDGYGRCMTASMNLKF